MKSCEKNRSEINDIYKWNLDTIYPSDEEWKKDFEILSNEYKKIDNFKNKIAISANSLYEFLVYYFNILEKEYRIFVYSALRKDQDIKNPKYQKMKAQADNLISSISNMFSFVEPELLKTDYSKIKEYSNSNNKLKRYLIYLEDIYRFQRYVLSPEKEKILSNLDIVYTNLEKTAEIIRNVEIDFGFFKDEDGNKIKLTNANYSKYIKTNDRKVRKSVYNKCFSGYEKVNGSLSTTYVNHLNIDTIISKERNYKNSLNMYLFEDNITESVYHNLIETVNKNISAIQKYYKLKKQVLNLDVLYPYDLSAKMSKEYTKEYDFTECKKIITEALSIFGDNYISIIKKAFDENWIDVYSNQGKRSGFYSWGCYSANPVILANYQSTLNDVSAIAHELGHSVHTYLSNKNNNFENSEYKIFVAEVASLTNELVLSQYLLNKSNDKNEKLAVLDNILNLFVSNLFGATKGAEFEKVVHDKSDKNDTLTSEILNNEYETLNKKYYGKIVKSDKYSKYGWSRISHFYSSFYYYKYATGISAATYIAKKIIKGDKEILQKYLKFLTLGSSISPIEELKSIGLDMNDSKVIEEAINFFEQKIDEFDDIINK